MKKAFNSKAGLAGCLTGLALLLAVAACSHENAAPSPPIEISFKANDVVLWNGDPITFDELHTRLKAEAARDPPIHIAPDRDAGYGWFARFNAMVEEFKLTKVGVVGGT